MATPGKDTPPFLANNPAASSGGKCAANPPYDDRPQKDGTSNSPAAAPTEKFPNRPQPTTKPAYNPESVPNGGTTPYPGPSQPTQKPFKLG